MMRGRPAPPLQGIPQHRHPSLHLRQAPPPSRRHKFLQHPLNSHHSRHSQHHPQPERVGGIPLEHGIPRARVGNHPSGKLPINFGKEREISGVVEKIFGTTKARVGRDPKILVGPGTPHNKRVGKEKERVTKEERGGATKEERARDVVVGGVARKAGAQPSGDFQPQAPTIPPVR